MASEPIECQVLALRVSIHCEGCKKKVKKVLLHVDGVYRCDIDGRSNKVMVTATRRIDANMLVAKLRKSGKQAEPWPEEPKQQQQQPAESQSQETKNQSDEPPSKQNEPAANAEAAAAAEPSNAQHPPEPKKTADETPKPAQQCKEATSSKVAADGNAGDEAKPPLPASAAGQQPGTEARGKVKQQHQEEKPIDATVTVGYDRGGYVSRAPAPPPPQPQPVHVMSYNMARPTTSAAYYAAAPSPAPALMAPRPRPSQQGYIDEYSPRYIDEYSAPSYYNRSSPYEPYYYPQPSPYRYQNSSTDDYYYGGAPPQRSVFSPPRDAYGDMFNDENANSCSVM